MLIWVLVSEKFVTLAELETTWSLDDALRLQALIEYKNAIQAEQGKEAKAKTNKGKN